MGKMFGGLSSRAGMSSTNELSEEQQKWQKLRAGLKLRNIVSSKRMNEVKIDLLDSEVKKCIISRMIGHKDVMPGSGQWTLSKD